MSEDFEDRRNGQIQELSVKIARLEERLMAADKALELARQISTAWQLSSNEWRKENIDQRALYPTSDKVTALISAVEIRLTLLEKVNQEKSGEFTGSINVLSVINTVLILVLAALAVFRHN